MRTHSSSGFTYLELLVSVVLLGIIAVGASSLFLSLIRGGGKVNVGTVVKQNGQAALSAMEVLIRNSDEVSSCFTGGTSSIQLVGKDGGETQLACIDDYIASNSARMTSEEVEVVNCSFACDTDTPTTTTSPLVTVNFTLKQKGTPSEKYEQAEVQFSTAVVVRNY